MVRNHTSVAWNLQFKCPFSDWEILEVARLLSELEGFACGGEENKRIWVFD